MNYFFALFISIVIGVQYETGPEDLIVIGNVSIPAYYEFWGPIIKDPKDEFSFPLRLVNISSTCGLNNFHLRNRIALFTRDSGDWGCKSKDQHEVHWIIESQRIGAKGVIRVLNKWPTGTKATSMILTIPTISILNESLPLIEDALAKGVSVTFMSGSEKMQRSYLSHVIQFYFHYTYAVGFYSFLFFYALFIISMRFKKYGFDRSLIGYHIALIFIWLFSVFRLIYLITDWKGYKATGWRLYSIRAWDQFNDSLSLYIYSLLLTFWIELSLKGKSHCCRKNAMYFCIALISFSFLYWLVNSTIRWLDVPTDFTGYFLFYIGIVITALIVGFLIAGTRLLIILSKSSVIGAGKKKNRDTLKRLTIFLIVCNTSGLLVVVVVLFALFSPFTDDNMYEEICFRFLESVSLVLPLAFVTPKCQCTRGSTSTSRTTPRNSDKSPKTSSS